MENLTVTPEGVGLVVSPWNFPIAIPCGGILSMLAAGNTVIFKPASDSVLVAHELAVEAAPADTTRPPRRYPQRLVMRADTLTAVVVQVMWGWGARWPEQSVPDDGSPASHHDDSHSAPTRQDEV